MNSTRLLRGPALAVAALLLIGSAAFASQMALSPKEDGQADPTTEASDLHSLLAVPSAAESEQSESVDQSESAEPSETAEHPTSPRRCFPAVGGRVARRPARGRPA